MPKEELFLDEIEIDEEEVECLIEHRGVDRETAILAYRVSAADNVDLAEYIKTLRAG